MKIHLPLGEAYKRKWMWVLTGAVVGAGLSGALSYRQHRTPVAQSLAPDGAYCDSGIGAAKAYAARVPARGPPRQSNRAVKLLGFRKSTMATRPDQPPLE